MDFDRETGALIDNYLSAVQSVGVILSTRLYELVMLRQFGGGLVVLLGRLMTPELFATAQILIAASIDLWEPRFRVRKVSVGGNTDDVRLGSLNFRVEVDWRPRGHLGDDTVEAVKDFTLTVSSAGISTGA